MAAAPPPYPIQGKDSAQGNADYENVPHPQTHTTVVNIIASDVPAHDYLPWSIFNTLYMNFCCLGLVALVYSVKSRDRKVLGDKFGAMRYGVNARILNIVSTTLTIVCIIIVLIFINLAPRDNRGHFG